MAAARTTRGECLALLGALAAAIAYSNCFASPAAAPRGGPSAASPLRDGLLRASGGAAAGPSGRGAGGDSRAGLCGLAAAAVAVGVLRAEQRRRRATTTACRAFGFGSSSSGFMGDSTATAYIASEPVQAVDAEAPRQDVCALTGIVMRGNVWWEKPTGKDERWGRIFDWERRESRRRGEELFRHDVDNFEMRNNNLVGAPGSRKRKVVLGRSKYGHKGRTCGYGQKGQGKRGRKTTPPGFQSGMVPFHHLVPKMHAEDKEDRRMRERNKRMAHINIEDLERCDDGDELDYNDLVMRGMKTPLYRFQQVKVFGKEEDELSVKNLTVYAHHFEPTAREKIEAVGGTCVRLDEISNIPVQLEFKRQQEAEA